MNGRRLSALAPIALVVTLGGCGQRAPRVPASSALPLVGGAGIVASARQCDPGANAFCALQLVVTGSRYPSSGELLRSENRRLRQLGWTATHADIGDERAAESPGRRVRVTYATADGDLQGIEQGWIKRSRTIYLALDRTLFDRTPAISVMLEAGAS
ncbi:MAG: hypothetical protein ACR2IP_04495 [Solirubrobacteraceae bacterium]